MVYYYLMLIDITQQDSYPVGNRLYRRTPSDLSRDIVAGISEPI